jgi:hypothetical protein
MTTINCLMLFWEIIAFYYENHMKPINTLCGKNADLLIIKAGGTYTYLPLFFKVLKHVQSKCCNTNML